MGDGLLCLQWHHQLFAKAPAPLYNLWWRDIGHFGNYYSIYALLFLTGSPPPGITTIIILLIVAIGLNSYGIGILGEYLGRTYSEVKRRPLYIVAETVNLPSASNKYQ